MYSYNNSFIDKFRNNININGYGDKNPSAPLSEINRDTVDKTQMPNVTPDFNVSVPIGYSKLGIKTLSNGQEIHCYKLNNGQKVFIAPKDSAKTVLNTYVNTGALNEKDDERGISHFCEHMAFNGTKGTNGYMKLDSADVFKLVSEMGGYTNASTNFAETNYTISIPQFKSDDFETIVKMQSSMMNNLEMSESMTEKEHGPVTSEINMYSDIADTIAMNTAAKNLYNIQTKSPDIVAGTVENILNVDSKKVMDYYKNNYYPSNMTTVVTGDVNPDEAIELISKHFKGENPKNPERRVEPLTPIQSPIRKDIISKKTVGTTGVLCFNGPANNDPKANIEVQAVNHLLFNKKHSKTTSALEPYHVEVNAGMEKFRSEPADSKLLTLNYTTTEENSEIALKSIYDIINNFKEPSEDEMDTIKTALKMKYEKEYENTEDLNYLIGQTSLTGSIDECTDAIKIIDNLTAKDLTNAVKKYYDLNKVSIAVVHPESVKEDDITENHTKAKSISFTGTTPVTSKPRLPMNTSGIEKLTLKNNCEIALTDSKTDIAAFSVNITDNIPANTKPGVMNVLEEIIMKGSNEVVNLVDKNNITAYSGANNKNMYYEAELPAKNLPISLRIMKNALLNPDFSQKTFEKAKKDLKTELLTQQPNALDNAKDSIFPDSPRGYSRQEILKNLDNITLEEVMGLHKYIIDNGSMTFAASLPMNKYPEIKPIVIHELEEMPTFAKNTPRIFNDFVKTPKSKVITDTANTAQADIVQAYKFNISHNPKDMMATSLMNYILGRGDDTGLFNNLREKEKLAYVVESGLVVSPYNSGVLFCSILTTTDSPDLKSYDNVQKSIQGFHNQINKILNGEFSDKEFEAAKLGLKRQLLDSGEGQTNKVMRISEGLNSQNGIEELNKKYQMIDSLTREDIINSAQNVFSNKPIYSIRASKDTLNFNKEYLEGLEN